MKVKKNLTDLSIRKLKPHTARYDVWDAKVSNLGIRVFPSGVKSFFLSYYHNNQKRRDTLGRYPELSLLEARRQAFDRKSSLVQGRDPQIVSQGTDFHAVLDQFLELHCARHNKPSTQKATKIFLQNECLPHWKDLPINKITRGHILLILDAIMASGRHATANNTHAAISKFFNWCLARGLIETSPLAGVQRPAKRNTKDRTLTDREITSIWQSTDYYPFGTIVRLLLLTGTRRNEIASMEWNWIDDNYITIPASHTKNSNEHTLPITNLIRDTLDAIPNTGDKLFPARGAPHNSFSGFSKCKKRLDKHCGFSNFTLHDLRRTTATHMAEMGIQPHIIERVLNHSTGTISGVAAIYNRHAYMDEMRDALNQWNGKIQQLVST